MEAAAVEIGLSLAEFYDLTPSRFLNLFDRYLDREVRHARQASIMSVLYANAHRDEETRPDPFTIEDFAPALRNHVNQRPTKPFDGPAFLRPCDECGTPKWQGHLPHCQAGQRQFQGTLDKVTRATERAREKAETFGKGFLAKR